MHTPQFLPALPPVLSKKALRGTSRCPAAFCSFSLVRERKLVVPENDAPEGAEKASQTFRALSHTVGTNQKSLCTHITCMHRLVVTCPQYTPQGVVLRQDEKSPVVLSRSFHSCKGKIIRKEEGERGAKGPWQVFSRTFPSET